MAWFDNQWFTGIQTAATTLGGILAGAAGGALLVWRNFSKTKHAVANENENVGWIRDMRADMRRGDLELGEARAEIRALNVMIGDLRSEVGGLRAQVAGYQERLQESRERLSEIAEGRERLVGQCEERVRSLNDQLLDQRMANGRLFMALTNSDKAAAERLLDEHLSPALEQAKKGAESA